MDHLTRDVTQRPARAAAHRPAGSLLVFKILICYSPRRRASQTVARGFMARGSVQGVSSHPLTQGWRRWRTRGQALVETLLELPILLLLVLGLIGLGQILLANYTVTQAARAAAHQAAIAGGGGAGEAAAQRTVEQVIGAGVGMEPEQAQVAVACDAPCRRYAPITVTVRYRGEFWAPLPPLFTAFEVRAEAVRAAERDQH
ncbi:MAG: pilus assembly protein [Chloroflexaceae bacterium]|nr:pilus assembly protein [Chloroflexaceae bacterium]